jgi:16S rRNA (cytosine1402-N4)-methyltransferase
MLAQLQPGSTLHCLDRDADALAFAADILKSDSVNVVFHHNAFAELASCVAPASVDGILYDLGVSSHQLDERTRGFTLNGSTQALDLRMDQRESKSAQEWLQETDVATMAHVFRANADMDRAFPLARKIKDQLLVAAEEVLPFNVGHLRAAVDSIFRDRRFDQNSLMARVLQAIRMDINQEMPQIETSLRAAVEALLPGGRLCVISYHSVEDRTVKVTMAEYELDCICPPRSPMCMCGGNRRKVKKLLRKPGLPSAEELKKNPRSRSAKLRVYEKV